MKKIIAATLVVVPTIFLSGCYVATAPSGYYYSSYRPNVYYSGWGGGYWGGRYHNNWYRHGTWGRGGWGHHGGWGYAGRHGGGGHWHR